MGQDVFVKNIEKGDALKVQSVLTVNVVFGTDGGKKISPKKWSEAGFKF